VGDLNAVTLPNCFTHRFTKDIECVDEFPLVRQASIGEFFIDHRLTGLGRRLAFELGDGVIGTAVCADAFADEVLYTGIGIIHCLPRNVVASARQACHCAP